MQYWGEHSIPKPVSEHYKIFLPPNPILVHCGLFNQKFGQNILYIYIVRKVIEVLKWSQNENKLIYQIQFVVERSDRGLYRLLEGMFLWRQFLRNFNIKAPLWRLIKKVPEMSWRECL